MTHGCTMTQKRVKIRLHYLSRICSIVLTPSKNQDMIKFFKDPRMIFQFPIKKFQATGI